MKTYLVKCTWHSTAFTLQILAASETDALHKARRNKNTKTALSFKVIGSR